MRDFVSTFISEVKVSFLGFIGLENSFYSYHWFLSSALIVVLYSYFNKQKSILRLNSFINFILTPEFKKGFKRDCLWYLLRFIYKPFLFGVLFLKRKAITNFAVVSLAYLGFESVSPFFILDPVFGFIFLSIIHFIYLDFIYFVSHYSLHKIKWIWYFHQIHHNATTLSPLTKTRIHPVEYIIEFFTKYFLGFGGLFLISSLLKVSGYEYNQIGIPIVSFILFEAIAPLRHSHIKINYGFMSHILISPHMHQIHHSMKPEHVDKNFGVVFSIWDRVFGTLYIPHQDEETVFGVKGYEDIVDKKMSYEFMLPFYQVGRDINKFFCGLPDTKSMNIVNQKVKVDKRKASSAGFSLIEVMMTSGIAAFIFLIGSTLILSLVLISGKQKDINTAESDLESLEYVLKNLAATAVNVRFCPAPCDLDGVRSSNDGQGYVRRFTYREDTSMGTKPSTNLMFFAREVTVSSLTPAALASTFRPTGVFFIRKNEVFNENRRGGRITIDLGQANANGLVLPANADLFFEHISDIIINEPQFSSENVLQAVKVSVTAIYPIASEGIGYNCLGPTLDISNGLICNDVRTTSFKTVNRTFTLEFPNNKRDTVFSVAEFQNGLYFFKPAYGTNN